VEKFHVLIAFFVMAVQWAGHNIFTHVLLVHLVVTFAIWWNLISRCAMLLLFYYYHYYYNYYYCY